MIRKTYVNCTVWLLIIVDVGYSRTPPDVYLIYSTYIYSILHTEARAKTKIYDIYAIFDILVPRCKSKI